jgi:hypothetical protein
MVDEPEMVRWAWIDADGLCTAAGTCPPGSETWAQDNLPPGQLFVTGRPEQVRAGQRWVYDALAETWSQLPEPVPTLAALKAAKSAQLDAVAWDRRQFFGYDGEPDAFCDRARGPVVEALTARRILQEEGGVEPPAQNWQLSATAWRTWNTAQLSAYGLAVAAAVQANFDHKQTLALAIQAAADAPALDAIDITTGWPS